MPGFAFLGGIPRWAWEVVGGAIAAAVLIILIYRSGEHAAEAQANLALAKHNAELAATYQRQAIAAQAASAAGDERNEKLRAENQQLKEAVNAAAQGNASPGVDRAVHGLQPPGGKAGASKLPSRSR